MNKFTKEILLQIYKFAKERKNLIMYFLKTFAQKNFFSKKR